MPSLRHALLVQLLPRLRGHADSLPPEAEDRARYIAANQSPKPLPTKVVPAFARRFEVETGEAFGIRTFTITARGSTPKRTVVYLHGGGYVGGIDAFHVRYVTRLAASIDARIVLPDYPLAPEHTWRDSHQQLADLVAREVVENGPVVLAGDSAGGGYALAVAQTMRDRNLALPEALLLIAPWVDLTFSSPETNLFDEADPWLALPRLQRAAAWWAGQDADLARPEVSPLLGELAGLPRTLMLYGTLDLVAPGCRQLRQRAVDSSWALTAIEEPDLLHVYPMLPLIPEANRAWRQTLSFLGAS